MQRQINASEQQPIPRQKTNNIITSIIGTINKRGKVLLTISKAIQYFYHDRKWLFILPNLLVKTLMALISTYWLKKHFCSIAKQTIHRSKIQHTSTGKIQKKSVISYIDRTMHPSELNQ